MMRPCDISLTGCPGVDAPITNISAEAPDLLLFASTIWDPYRPYRPPVLGNAEYNDTDCNSIFGPLWSIYDPVVYAETQLMANLIALATQLGCGHPEVPPEDPTAPTQVYINDAQTQSVFCPDGSEFSYTVDAGTLTSPPLNSTLGPIWVDWANAWAASYALQQASELMDCVTRPEQPPGITPGGHTDPVIPPPPGSGGTPLLDLGFYWCCLGETLDEADNTYTFGGRGNAEYTITVAAGSIPPGTTFTQTGPRSCTLTGTPTQAGNWAWKIHAVSTTFPTVTIDVWDNLFVFGLTSGDPPDASEGTPYGPFQLTASGGNGTDYTFVSNDLPVGFLLTSAGVLTSDDTTVAGDYTFTVTVTDELGAFCDQEVGISVLLGGCVPDTGPIAPVTQPAFISDTLQIDNWAVEKLGLLAPTADPAGVQPEWDGTFPVRDLTTVPGWVFYLPTGSAPPIYVALAFNGLLGDTGGILLLQGGGTGPWTLDFNGFVGGVPTAIWHGEKAVGSCGAGTYMRISGLATGPACFHVTGCADALTWWPMTVNPQAETDSVNALVLSNPLGLYWASHVAGVISTALRLHSEGAQDSTSTCTNTALSLTTTGITIVGWVKNTYNSSVPGDNWTLVRYRFYEGATPHVIDASVANGAGWDLAFDAIVKVSKPWTPGWHFLVITYNPTTGDFGFDVDRTGMTTSVVAATAPTASASSQFLLSATAGAPVSGNADEDFDEFAIFNGILTDEQLDYLYNSGAGRTWPI